MAECESQDSVLESNSPKVAQRSYLLVTSDDFQKAIQGVEKSGTKSGTVKRNSGTISGTASASTVSQNVAKAQEKQGSDDVSLGKHLEKQADGEGFEHPSLSQGNSHFSTQAARIPARSAMEALLLEFWNAATDSAKFQALELLRLNSATNAK